MSDPDSPLGPPPKALRTTSVLDQLRELLASAAAADIPLVVGTEDSLRGGVYDFRIYKPPPVELAHPASPAGRDPETRAITAATDEAADRVRELAREAGVRLLSGDVDGKD